VVDRAEPGDLLSWVTGDTTQLRAATTANVAGEIIVAVTASAGPLSSAGSPPACERPVMPVLITVVVLTSAVCAFHTALLIAIVRRLRYPPW
jgi:hypothetical protein